MEKSEHLDNEVAFCKKKTVCLLEFLQNVHHDSDSGGKMDEESMMTFMKEMKNTTELTDEEIAALAAAKIQDNKPKSRM